MPLSPRQPDQPDSPGAAPTGSDAPRAAPTGASDKNARPIARTGLGSGVAQTWVPKNNNDLPSSFEARPAQQRPADGRYEVHIDLKPGVYDLHIAVHDATPGTTLRLKAADLDLGEVVLEGPGSWAQRRTAVRRELPVHEPLVGTLWLEADGDAGKMECVRFEPRVTARLAELPPLPPLHVPRTYVGRDVHPERGDDKPQGWCVGGETWSVELPDVVPGVYNLKVTAGAIGKSGLDVDLGEHRLGRIWLRDTGSYEAHQPHLLPQVFVRESGRATLTLTILGDACVIGDVDFRRSGDLPDIATVPAGATDEPGQRVANVPELLAAMSRENAERRTAKLDTPNVFADRPEPATDDDTGDARTFAERDLATGEPLSVARNDDIVDAAIEGDAPASAVAAAADDAEEQAVAPFSDRKKPFGRRPGSIGVPAWLAAAITNRQADDETPSAPPATTPVDDTPVEETPVDDSLPAWLDHAAPGSDDDLVEELVEDDATDVPTTPWDDDSPQAPDPVADETPPVDDDLPSVPEDDDTSLVEPPEQGALDDAIDRVLGTPAATDEEAHAETDDDEPFVVDEPEALDESDELELAWDEPSEGVTDIDALLADTLLGGPASDKTRDTATEQAEPEPTPEPVSEPEQTTIDDAGNGAFGGLTTRALRRGQTDWEYRFVKPGNLHAWWHGVEGPMGRRTDHWSALSAEADDEALVARAWSAIGASPLAVRRHVGPTLHARLHGTLTVGWQRPDRPHLAHPLLGGSGILLVRRTDGSEDVLWHEPRLDKPTASWQGETAQYPLDREIDLHEGDELRLAVRVTGVEGREFAVILRDDLSLEPV